MAKWQPPIPSGALWSQEVIQSNAGALLAYCYDAVLTDGTFTIQLAETSGEMGVDYRTIKRWWSALRAGSFFKSVQDKGRKGFLVRMSDDWLDWRILKARQTVQAEGPKTSPEIESEGSSISPDDAQVVLKGISRTDERPSMSLENNAYKVLITTDQNSDSSLASDDAVTPPAEAPKAKPVANRKPKVKAAMSPEPPSDHKRLLQEYADVLGYPIANYGKEAAGARKLLDAGYTVEQVIAAYCEMKADKFWGKSHISLVNVHSQIGAILNAREAKMRAERGRTKRAAPLANGFHPAAPLPTPQQNAEWAREIDLFNERGKS